jgi:hypothetical protein
MDLRVGREANHVTDIAVELVARYERMAALADDVQAALDVEDLMAATLAVEQMAQVSTQIHTLTHAWGRLRVSCAAGAVPGKGR